MSLNPREMALCIIQRRTLKAVLVVCILTVLSMAVCHCSSSTNSVSRKLSRKPSQKLEITDHDKDRIEDKWDRCPAEEEDLDGWKDDDGCPDPDNDEDGIADAVDHCPNDPEVYNERNDEDGCPEH